MLGGVDRIQTYFSYVFFKKFGPRLRLGVTWPRRLTRGYNPLSLLVSSLVLITCGQWLGLFMRGLFCLWPIHGGTELLNYAITCMDAPVVVLSSVCSFFFSFIFIFLW